MATAAGGGPVRARRVTQQQQQHQQHQGRQGRSRNRGDRNAMAAHNYAALTSTPAPAPLPLALAGHHDHGHEQGQTFSRARPYMPPPQPHAQHRLLSPNEPPPHKMSLSGYPVPNGRKQQNVNHHNAIMVNSNNSDSGDDERSLLSVTRPSVIGTGEGTVVSVSLINFITRFSHNYKGLQTAFLKCCDA